MRRHCCPEQLDQVVVAASAPFPIHSGFQHSVSEAIQPSWLP